MKQELVDMLGECDKELADIEQRIKKLSAFDKEKLYLTNYALIKACGTVEFIYRSIVADYFSKLNSDKIDKYIDTNIRSGSMSATYDNMSRLLGKFDDNWKKNFQNNVNQRGDKNKLISDSESLVTNRHSFAHGKTPSATFSDIKRYYSSVVILIRILDKVVC